MSLQFDASELSELAVGLGGSNHQNAEGREAYFRYGPKARSPYIRGTMNDYNWNQGFSDQARRAL